MSKILKSFGMAALLVALLAGTGMAQTDATDTTSISGTVSDWISVDAPAAISGWSLLLGDNEYSSDDLPTVNFASNVNDASIYLKVHDARTGFTGTMTAGHMTDDVPASATKELTAAMVVEVDPDDAGTGTGAGPITLDGTAETAYTSLGSATFDEDLEVSINQNIGSGDIADTYQITVTFTGTATA